VEQREQGTWRQFPFCIYLQSISRIYGDPSRREYIRLQMFECKEQKTVYVTAAHLYLKTDPPLNYSQTNHGLFKETHLLSRKFIRIVTLIFIERLVTLVQAY
jgi:hypothetical protein